ncbi:MAG: hypothetical protein ACFCVF_03155 [Kineosporiaceae bacterium]
MRTSLTLAAYGGGLAVAFAVAFAVGQAVGDPFRDPEPEAPADDHGADDHDHRQPEVPGGTSR